MVPSLIRQVKLRQRAQMAGKMPMPVLQTAHAKILSWAKAEVNCHINKAINVEIVKEVFF